MQTWDLLLSLLQYIYIGTTDMIFSLRQIQEKCPMWYLSISQKPLTLNREMYSKETRVPWPLRQVLICLCIQIKKRTFGIIWGWEHCETGLCCCPHTVLSFSFYGLVWCLHWFHPNGYRVDQRWTCSMPTKLSLQKRPEIFRYTSLCLLMTLPLWDTIKIHKK